MASCQSFRSRFAGSQRCAANAWPSFVWIALSVLFPALRVQSHADPEGQHLASVAAALHDLSRKCRKTSFGGHGYAFDDMGVFWGASAFARIQAARRKIPFDTRVSASCNADWASLFQKDPALFDPNETPEAKAPGKSRMAFEAALRDNNKFYGGKAYEDSRNSEQKKKFRFALRHTMDL